MFFPRWLQWLVPHFDRVATPAVGRRGCRLPMLEDVGMEGFVCFLRALSLAVLLIDCCTRRKTLLFLVLFLNPSPSFVQYLINTLV